MIRIKIGISNLHKSVIPPTPIPHTAYTNHSYNLRESITQLLTLLLLLSLILHYQYYYYWYYCSYYYFYFFAQHNSRYLGSTCSIPFCEKPTRRWPMALFYNLVDIAGYNSFLLYSQKHPMFVTKHQNQARREFLKILCKELMTEYNENDAANDFQPNLTISNPLKRGWCQICTRITRKEVDYSVIIARNFVAMIIESNRFHDPYV